MRGQLPGNNSPLELTCGICKYLGVNCDHKRLRSLALIWAGMMDAIEFGIETENKKRYVVHSNNIPKQSYNVYQLVYVRSSMLI